MTKIFAAIVALLITAVALADPPAPVTIIGITTCGIYSGAIVVFTDGSTRMLPQSEVPFETASAIAEKLGHGTMVNAPCVKEGIST
jgi:hypothetical protein